ncbi:MAG: hypothetical protein ABWX94_02625 [Candidatus Saccharimonadales bacterium]
MTNSDGTLANTGIAVIALVTVACLIIFVALLVRVWRRKPAPTLLSVTVDEDQNRE